MSFMKPYKMPKTKRGAWRQYDAIWNAYRRAYAGGGMFGFDWPTFRVNWPEAYDHIQKMKEAFPSLPD